MLVETYSDKLLCFFYLEQSNKLETDQNAVTEC